MDLSERRDLRGGNITGGGFSCYFDTRPKFGTGGYVESSPALGNLDGDRYLDLAVVSCDDYLYIFEATVKGGKVVWSRFRGDSDRSGLYENVVSFAEYNLGGQAFY